MTVTLFIATRSARKLRAWIPAFAGMTMEAGYGLRMKNDASDATSAARARHSATHKTRHDHV